LRNHVSRGRFLVELKRRCQKDTKPGFFPVEITVSGCHFGAKGFVVRAVFAIGAVVILTVVLRAFEIERGSMSLPSRKSDGALFIFLGLIGLLVFAYIIRKRVAHFLRRSQVRFYRVYRHQ
jgi:hypothetical protein